MRQLSGHRKYHLKYQGVFSLTSTAGRVHRNRGSFIISRCAVVVKARDKHGGAHRTG